MNRLALYRQYRPQKFTDVIGQEPVVRVLEAMLKKKSVPQANLFIGSRGTGKTSVARILARALGCQAEDLYEIDGASNRGIDEIRALREAVQTLPLLSPFKVYIIDEVHMLTREAFNALLKTLEEPPPHVIFILATTEGHKVPETITSRCQVFHFAKPGQRALMQAVERVLKVEKWQVEPAALELITLLGDGSFRDTYGLVEKAMAVSQDKKIIVSEVEAVTGAPGTWLVYNLILTILNGDVAGGLSVVGKAVASGFNFKILLKLVLRELRLALLFIFQPEIKKSLQVELGEEEYKFLESVASRPDARSLPKVLRELLAAYEETSEDYLPELPLELAIIKLVGQDKD